MSLRKISIPYGAGQLEFELPAQNLAGILAPQAVAPAADPEAAIDQALDAPLDTRPIEQLVHPGERALILVDDYTRMTPAARVLPHLLARLQRGGVRAEDISLLVSTGTHRPSTEAEVRQKVGEAVWGRYPVFQHDCQASGEQAFLGITSRGTPVWVNRRVVEADRVFGIGHIDPSDYAGYAGGRKLIVPGVAALETVDANHAMAALSFRNYGRVDLPCRLDIDEAGALVRADLFLNLVLCQDGQIACAFAGSPEAIHRAGVAQARQVYEVPCPGGPVDGVIASAYPYDIDFYQAIRAVEYADAITRPGGGILLVAPCPDGMGSPDFYRLLAEPGKTPDDFLRDVARRNGKVTHNVLGYFLARIRQEKRVLAFSEGMRPAAWQAIGIQPVASLAEGVACLLAEAGPQGRLAVLPVGSATIPRLA